MGLMDRIERPRLGASVTWDPLDDRWYSNLPSGGETWAGFPVSPTTAMQVSTVKACVSLIADIIGRLPCILYKKRRDGGADRATDHPLYTVLTRRPNQRQSPFRFFRYMTGQLALRGNGYAQINSPLSLVPMFPENVTVEELDSGRARYKVRRKNGTQDTLLQEEVLHLVDDGDDPTTGTARAVLARQAIAVSAAAEAYAGRFFKNDATGRLLLTKTGAVPDEKKREDYRKMIQENYAGYQNSSRAMILYGDVQATELGKQADSAFIVDPRKHQATEICRYWRVQPFMIGLEDKITWGTNIEQVKSAFVDFTAMPWGVNIEQELMRALLTDNEMEDYQIKFLYDALLRGDTLSRYQAYALGRNMGVWSPNDILKMEDHNPRTDPGGDKYQETPTGGAPNAGKPSARSSGGPVSTSADENAVEFTGPMLADAAARLAHAEVTAVAARAEKAKEDGLKFVAWARKFASDQKASTIRVLTPLAAEYGLPSLAVTESAERLERTMVAALGVEGPPQGWCEARRAEVQTIIEETFRAAAAVRQEAA